MTLGRSIPAALLMWAALGAAAPAADALHPFEARYSVRIGGVTVGRMERALVQLDGKRYAFESTTKASGPLGLVRRERVRETSVWEMTPNGVRAIEYRYARTGGRKDRRLTVLFDAERGTITSVAGTRASTLALDPRAVDKLAYQALLMRDLELGSTDPSYVIAEGDELKRYEFRLVEPERLTTPAGTFDTVKLERSNPGEARETVLWCAPQLGYLPVRVDYREQDGVLTRVVLERYQNKADMAYPASSAAVP